MKQNCLSQWKKDEVSDRVYFDNWLLLEIQKDFEYGWKQRHKAIKIDIWKKDKS